MDCTVTTMGERGQVVIPQGVREELGLGKGAKFTIMANGELIILQRMRNPTWGEFQRMLTKARGHVRQHGITKKDMRDAIQKARSRA